MSEREKAIEMIKQLTSGKGFNWSLNKGPILMGKIAQDVWFDGMFTYGMEYGACIALAYVFGITEDELK